MSYITSKVICDYCEKPARLVSGKSLYPHRPDLFKHWFYQCEPCSAYVGTHKKTTRPLGRLANADLRRWKSEAHKAFDPIWQSGKMRKSLAYFKLAKQLQITTDQCHIGMFDVATCKRVIALCSSNSISWGNE